jgi:enoyl-CoA hydratase/carnithine racemase
MDLRSFAGGDALGTGGDEAGSAFQRLMRGDVRIPLVGAANGSAVAGGLELLLACDLIVASSRARFGLPEVQRGFLSAGSGAFLSTRIPLSVALELALTGDLIPATRAYDVGLVNAVVEPDAVLATAMAFANRIAENAPLGVAAAKELARLALTDPARARERLDAIVPHVFASDDAGEGARAFIEKRKPVWRGR